MSNRNQVLIRVATMENDDPGLARWQRAALLAGAATLALAPFGVGVAHGFYQAPGAGPLIGGDDGGAPLLGPIPDADGFGIQTPASAKSAKSAKSGKKAKRSQPAARIAPQAQAAVQPVIDAPVVRAQVPNEAGGTGSPAVETPPFATSSSYQLSDTQAMAVAGSLGGGLTAQDVKAMTKDELIAAAKAKGVSPDQVADAAGIPRGVLNQSVVPSGDILAAGGLLLASSAALLRRLRPR